MEILAQAARLEWALPMKTLSCLLLLSLAVLTACVTLPEDEPAVSTQAQPADLPARTVHLAAVGDIADCRTEKGAAARATGDLLRTRFPGVTVLALGDLVYENGTSAEFANCYHRVWRELRERTRPAPGNHDYGIYIPVRRNTADPYFRYFGTRAGPPGKGFYSFDLGAWHIVSLNSMAGGVAAAPSTQEQTEWLETDLAETRQPCLLAYWHHPLFSSGHHGYDSADPGRRTDALWQGLARHGTDVIVNGHDHHYERFAPQTPDGRADRAGIREFVVGTGGARIRPVQRAQPNSEAILDDPGDHGVLLLTLHPGSYEWQWIRTDGSIGDRSEEPQACHGIGNLSMRGGFGGDDRIRTGE